MFSFSWPSDVLWWSEGLLRCLKWPGVIKGQLSAIKGPVWSSVCTSHHFSLRPAVGRQEIFASRCSCSFSVCFSWNGSQSDPGSFLHRPSLLLWGCVLYKEAQISQRPRDQSSIQKSVFESSQPVPAVHDAAVSLLQDGWYHIVSSCQHYYCTGWQPISTKFRLHPKSCGKWWVNWVVSVLYIWDVIICILCFYIAYMHHWIQSMDLCMLVSL